MAAPDEELVRDTAKLARLELDEQETSELARDFATILGAFHSLQEVVLDGPGRGTDSSAGPPPALGARADVLREDRGEPGLERADVLAAAPRTVDGFFAVPRVIATSGDDPSGADE